MSITESVYTHIDMKKLINAINSMYYPEEIKKGISKSNDKHEKSSRKMER